MCKKYLFGILIVIGSTARGQLIEWIDTIKYSSSTSISDLCISSDSNVIILGNYSSGSDPKNGRVFLSEYSAGGIQQWIDDKTTIGYLSNLKRDKFGNIYFSGWFVDGWGIVSTISGATVSPATYLVKYSGQGTVLWISQKQNPYTIPGSVIINSKGNIETRSSSYGHGVNYIYNSSGSFLSYEFEPPVLYGQYDKFGNAYQQYDSDIVKYDPSGTKLWSFPISNGYTKFVIDNSGSCYLWGRQTASLSVVAKISASGQLLWSKSIDSWTESISCDDTNLYIGALYEATSGTVTRVYKFDTMNGNIIWQSDISTPNDFWVNTMTSSKGVVYVTAKGRENVNCYLAKITDQSWIPTGVTKNTVKPEFLIYPNPTNNDVFVSYTNQSTEPLLVKIYDMNGKCVHEQKFHNFSDSITEKIELEHLAKGVYLLEVNSEDNKYTRKLVKE